MKRKLSKNYFYIAFMFVLILTGSTLFYFFNINKGLWWDEAVYLGLAKNLYLGKGYFINLNQETFRPPLFAFLISLLWRFFGISELLIRFLLPIIAIFSIIVLYIFTKKLYGEEIALWASLILATSHMFLFYSLKILTESIFILLSLLFIYSYHIAIEKNRKYFLLSGVLMGLSFLTRYPGLILPAFYLIYPIFLKKGKTFFREKFYWLGILSFLTVLIPWFWLSQMNFGSPIGALFVEAGTVTEKWYIGEWYYYFAHWFEMFGLIGIFIVPGAIVSLVKLSNRKNSFILVLASISLLFFMLIPRKELRYMIHYLPVYIILFSIGIVELRKWMGSKRIIPLVAILFLILNFLAGIQMIFYDKEGGKALKEAGIYLSGVAPKNTTIMSQNMPVLYYTAERNIVYFPENKENITDKVRYNNVSFIVIESREPTYPDYVWIIENGKKRPSNIFDNFILEKTFEEEKSAVSGILTMETFVWVYRVEG